MTIRQYLKKIQGNMQNMVNAYFRGEHNKHVRYLASGAIVAFVVFVVGYNAFFSPPAHFPAGTLISVKNGMTLNTVGALLDDKSVIRSQLFFTSIVRVIAGESGVLSGDYYFPIPETVWGVAMRITRGEYGLDPVRITIPEGATVKEVSEVLDWRLPSFPVETFLKLSENKEGYLFPDTYFFLPNVSPEQIIRTMEDNFKLKTSVLADKIKNSGHTLDQIIIMASILEKEALTLKDKKIISGILWKRISIGMPMQVDAPFVYGVGKNTFELTGKDLKIDSPYNTYTNKGLTPTPIANPGLDSITAAIEPKESPYLFYLSDRRGGIHYGTTFEDHKRNRRLYLN